MQILYMAVTPDKFELPVAVADSLDEMEFMTGITKSNISCAITRRRSGKHIGIKFIKIECEEDTEIEDGRFLYEKIY